MNIERVTALMHVGVLVVAVTVSNKIAVNLDSLGTVSLLSVEFTPVDTLAYIDGLNEESGLLLLMMMMAAMVVTSRGSLLAHHCLSSRVETEVSLGHQLLIERSIHCTIIVLLEVLRRVSYKLHISSLSRISCLIVPLPSFEQLRQDTLFLLVNMVPSPLVLRLMNTETLSLD
jgi:hypothetical protein